MHIQTCYSVNMADSMDRGTGRKRPREETDEEGSPKHQRASQSIGKAPDACVSQTFVTEDNRLITDSIPNHIRRHDAEIAKQGKSLHAVLNASSGFEERLDQYGARFEETQKSNEENKKSIEQNQNEIQQWKNNTVHEQFRQEIATLKDSMQTQFDSRDRKATQQNAEIHRKLSALAQCFQEPGNLPALLMDGSQAFPVQSVQARSNFDGAPIDAQGLTQAVPATAEADFEGAQDSPQPGKEGIGAGNTPTIVWPKRYFRWLENLDFRQSLAIDQYNEADYKFSELELFKHNSAKYYLVRGSAQVPPSPN